MDLILGIDQGASKTHALIGDCEGNVLGVGASKGAVHASVGLLRSMKMIRTAVEQAASRARVDIKAVSSCIAGLSGLDWDDEEEILHKGLHETLFIEDTTVVNDAIVAMRGGTSKPLRAVICAGSGLNIAAQNQEGEVYIYGYFIADDMQGGHALGRKAFQAVVDASTGMAPPTSLTSRLLSHFGLITPEDMLRSYIDGKINDRDFLALPRLIEEAAAEGDAVALDMMACFGSKCGDYVVNAMKKLNMLGAESDIVLSGGIFKSKVAVLRDSVIERVHRSAPKANIIDALYEPVAGAYLMGLDARYGTIPAEVIAKFEQSAEKLPLIRIKENEDKRSKK